MGRKNTPILEVSARQELEKGFKTGATHAFRKRCQLVLLKAEGRSSRQVALIVKLCEISVNSWLKRYQTQGIDGLRTKPGRGPKAKLDKLTDQTAALAAIKANRQRMQTAKAEFEAASGKKISRQTFRRFLKGLADATNA